MTPRDPRRAYSAPDGGTRNTPGQDGGEPEHVCRHYHDLPGNGGCAADGTPVTAPAYLLTIDYDDNTSEHHDVDRDEAYALVLDELASPTPGVCRIDIRPATGHDDKETT